MTQRPVARVLAALELLQTHRRISGPELARRLGVDGRTVRRYVATLEELGIPVTAERGRGGAYALVAGFKLPPLLFSPDEVVAVAVGLVAARGLGLSGAAAAASSAQAKLERVMPEPLRRRARAIGDTVALELARPRAPGNDTALAALTAAALARERVTLRYRSGQGEATERAFDAYGLAHRGGRWYAVGHCHLRGGVRSFRLDRVETVTGLGSTFERAEDFDALAHLSDAIARLPRAHAAEVLLATDLEGARRALFPAAGVLEPVPGGVLLHAQADELGWLARELSRLPFRFEVRGPPALRRELATHARRLARSARPAVTGPAARSKPRARPRPG